MGKAKIYELDLVRAFAILAVLFIHGTSDGTLDPPEGPPLGSRSRVIYIAINELSNFAVPVFILISGLVLFYRYFDTWKARDALSFYRKRLQFILVPYLVWSLFYYLFYGWLQHPDYLHMDVAEFLEKLKWADTGYHLYFMIIILQFYAIFPILVALAKKFAWFARNLALFGIVVHAAVFVYNHWIGDIPHLSTLCLQYFSLFCIGGYIGIRYDAFKSWLSKNIWWVSCLGTALGFTLMLAFELAPYDISFGQTVYFLLFNSYAVFIGMTLIHAGAYLLKKAPKLSAGLTSLGAASFGVYFIHPSLLSSWRTFVPVVSGTPAYHLVTIAGILIIVTIPWAIVALLKRFKFSWILFGK